MPQQYIDFAYVKEQAMFERVIAGYNLKLLGSGSQRSLLCPFHRERKASCKIDLDRRIFHCFGCGAKGNVLEFVARLEGTEGDLRNAALKIAELCGIATAAPRETVGAPAAVREHRSKGARARKAPTEANTADPAAVLSDHKPVNPPLTFELKLDASHPYLGERGVSTETVALFGLGHCSRGVMAGRVCIPIHNECGELVAYAGRWPGEDLPDGQERYRLPKSFEKSRVLFNLHRVSDAEHVVAVEGYWSVFRLHALGVPVVGLMGSSICAEQIALLRDRGTRYLTVLFDGDEAGKRARERALSGLASQFFVRAPLLADGQKPDTLTEADLRELVAFP